MCLFCLLVKQNLYEGLGCILGDDLEINEGHRVN